jgi:succinate dehydrogenase / fumarate reductase flavoprotein subunit
MNKFDKNEIEFTKNLLNQSNNDILTILKNEKINYFMLILPDLIKKDILPQNLDLSHIDSDYLDHKLGGILEIYEEFVGEDPRKVPMQIFPAIHYSMGGIWVDVTHRTNIPGLLASGECDYQYHGANRLGANSLLSAAYSGTVSGPSAMKWAKDEQQGPALTKEELEAAKKAEIERFESLLKMNGSENAYALHKELGDIMLENVSIVRFNDKLAATDVKLQELLKRWDNIGISDKGRWANQEVMFVRQLRDMIILARVITLAALKRDESRGAHYKPEFPNRDDEKYLKTTIAKFNPATNAPEISYIDFDHSAIKPRPRRYDIAKGGK